MRNIFNMLKSQKGAMFGLDARIALAIFGILSAGAGTMIFGIIAESRATALTRELDSVEQAYTNFVFDTGINTTTFTDLTDDSNVTNGWDGPYFTAIGDNHVQYGTYSLVEGLTTAATDPTTNACPAPPADCFMWVSLTEVPDQTALDIQEKMDGKHTAVGGTDTNSDGKFRISTVAGNNDTIFFRIAKR